MELHNLDSETAYSNGNRADEIKLKPPEGFSRDPAYSPTDRFLMRFNDRCRWEFDEVEKTILAEQYERTILEVFDR